MGEFEERYKVSVTGVALRQGQKLGISERAKQEIIENLKCLKYWPDSESIFEYEKVEGTLEFKFQNVEGKWIRVFVYQDDERKIMWVIKVMAKKSNQLRRVDLISLKTAVSRVEQDLDTYRKEEKKKKQFKLKILQGRTDE